jgi:hypothetical protein
LSLARDSEEPYQHYTFTITPLFVEHYINRLPNSLVYMSSCSSAWNETMSGTFENQGAAAYFGFSDTVDPEFTQDCGMLLFERLLDGYDSESAYEYDVETDLDPAEFLKFGSLVNLRPCAVGTWDLTYQWKGRQAKTVELYIEEDGAFSTNEEPLPSCDGLADQEGTWTQDGISYSHTYECGTHYVGTFKNSYTLSGTMVESDECDPDCNGGDTGEWYAIKH